MPRNAAIVSAMIVVGRIGTPATAAEQARQAGQAEAVVNEHRRFARAERGPRVVPRLGDLTSGRHAERVPDRRTVAQPDDRRAGELVGQPSGDGEPMLFGRAVSRHDRARRTAMRGARGQRLGDDAVLPVEVGAPARIRLGGDAEAALGGRLLRLGLRAFRIVELAPSAARAADRLRHVIRIGRVTERRLPHQQRQILAGRVDGRHQRRRVAAEPPDRDRLQHQSERGPQRAERAAVGFAWRLGHAGGAAARHQTVGYGLAGDHVGDVVVGVRVVGRVALAEVLGVEVEESLPERAQLLRRGDVEHVPLDQSRLQQRRDLRERVPAGEYGERGRTGRGRVYRDRP